MKIFAKRMISMLLVCVMMMQATVFAAEIQLNETADPAVTTDTQDISAPETAEETAEVVMNDVQDIQENDGNENVVTEIEVEDCSDLDMILEEDTRKTIGSFDVEVYSGNAEQYSESDIVVFSEEQLLDEGSQIQSIAEDAEMVYIPTKLSEEELIDAIGVEPEVLTEEDEEDGFNTQMGVAITCEDGNYYFDYVSMLFADEEESVDISDEIVEQAQTALASDNVIFGINDGIEAVLKTAENSGNEVTVTDSAVTYSALPSGYSTTRTNNSGVVYTKSGQKIGSMGYTLYFYKRGKSSSKRVFDSLCKATFSPCSNACCRNMSVILNTNDANDSTHTVIDETTIKSTTSKTNISLSLTAGTSGVSGTSGLSWNYTPNARKVTNSFDPLSSNKRKWTFKTNSSQYGDSWTERPGVRMISKRSDRYCYTRVSLLCPQVTIFGTTVSMNRLSKTHKFHYK